MERKKRKERARSGIAASTQKMSQMVWEFAGEFIRLGGTLEEKQNRLNAACSAWNIACNSPEVQNRFLHQYGETYRAYNPDVSDEHVHAARSVMEKLIQNKLRLFPAVNKQIVGAQITRVAGQERIDIASARLE